MSPQERRQIEDTERRQGDVVVRIVQRAHAKFPADHGSAPAFRVGHWILLIHDDGLAWGQVRDAAALRPTLEVQCCRRASTLFDRRPVAGWAARQHPQLAASVAHGA